MVKMSWEWELGVCPLRELGKLWQLRDLANFLPLLPVLVLPNFFTTLRNLFKRVGGEGLSWRLCW
jgi:hypothetical protein